MAWTKTQFKGIRYREHPVRKHGVQKDRYFSIRYKLQGKDHEEGLGWASAGWTAEKAVLKLAEIRQNHKVGEGPFSLREKRQQEFAKREQEAQEAAAAEKAARPFSEIWALYVDQCVADGKKSVDREGNLFKSWISPMIGTKPLGDIAPIHLEKIKSNMARAELSPRSVHYCLAVIRQVFNFASRMSLFAGENPTKLVKKPTADNRRMRFLTHLEADQLLEALKAKSLNCWMITLVSLHCGLRFGEIARLIWGDIDFERGTLFIRDPKNQRSRFSYMTKDVRQALLKRVPGSNSDLVFPDRNGGQRRAMSDSFDRVVASLGLNDGIIDDRLKVCFHTCRHTYASWLVKGGTDLLVVKELLGHKSLSMTERYSHLQPDTLQRAVQGLDRRLGEARRPGRKSKVVRLPSPV
jgi:integrase